MAARAWVVEACAGAGGGGGPTSSSLSLSSESSESSESEASPCARLSLCFRSASRFAARSSGVNPSSSSSSSTFLLASPSLSSSLCAADRFPSTLFARLDADVEPPVRAASGFVLVGDVAAAAGLGGASGCVAGAAFLTSFLPKDMGIIARSAASSILVSCALVLFQR